MRPAYMIIAVAIAILAILGFEYRQEITALLERDGAGTDVVATDQPELGPSDTAEAPVESPDEETVEPVLQAPVAAAPSLPPLAESDAFVMDELAQLLPSGWREERNVLPRAATFLVSAASGSLPRKEFRFVSVEDSYPVHSDGERFFTDPYGYARYDAAVGAFTAVPADRVVGLFDLVEPLLAEALGQLGERRSPRELAKQALAEIQATPVLPERVELVRPKVYYKYADPDLESRSTLQKQLMRMGPENVRRIRAYADALSQALG